jgi:hypothetical protein
MIYRISFILFQSVISITCYFMTCTPWLCLEVPQFSNRTNFASRTKRKKPWTFVAKCNNYNMCPVFGCFIYSGDKFLETITSFFFFKSCCFLPEWIQFVADCFLQSNFRDVCATKINLQKNNAVSSGNYYFVLFATSVWEDNVSGCFQWNRVEMSSVDNKFWNTFLDVRKDQEVFIWSSVRLPWENVWVFTLRELQTSTLVEGTERQSHTGSVWIIKLN